MSIELIMIGCLSILCVLLGVFYYLDYNKLADKLALPLTSTEVAEYLRVSPTTVRRMARRGKLRSYRIGKQYRFHGWYIRSLDIHAMHSEKVATDDQV